MLWASLNIFYANLKFHSENTNHAENLTDEMDPGMNTNIKHSIIYEKKICSYFH